MSECITEKDGDKMKIDCAALPMGFFFGRSEDGRVFIGKRDPVTKEILCIYQIENKDDE